MAPLHTTMRNLKQKCQQLITLACVGEFPINVKLIAVLPKLMFNIFLYTRRVSLNDDGAKAFVTWMLIMITTIGVSLIDFVIDNNGNNHTVHIIRY